MALWGTVPTLMLKKFNVNENADYTFTEIEGRPSGLISWILSLLKLDDITRLEVNKDNVLFKTASLYGEETNLVPLNKVSNTSCGFYKPFSLIVLSAIMLILALGALISNQGALIFVLLLLFAAGFFALYVFKKTLSIIVHSSGGLSMGLRFKRSIIENVDVDIEKVKSVIELINKKVLGK